MFVKQLLPALAAVAGLASAQSTCDKDWTINSQADAAALASCRSVKGNIVIGSTGDTEIDINGPTLLVGDFVAENNGRLLTLKSSSLQTIRGEMRLMNVTVMSSLGFTALNEVTSIKWQTLNALDALTFTAGVRTARNVSISDTFLRSLDGLNLFTVDTMFVNNNRRLTTWNSPMGNITDKLEINDNGGNALNVNLPSLTWAGNLVISNCTTFNVPSLKSVNDSIKFMSNSFQTFSAPNLTTVGRGSRGDISFVSNSGTSNISCPVLTSVAGGMLIANNTALEKLDGFPNLKTVGGAVKLRGSFKSISLPALSDVKGAFSAISAVDDMKDSCAVFAKQAPKGQGGNNQIQGKYDCGKDPAANSDTTGTGITGGGSGGSGGGGNAAAGFSVNMASVLGLTLVAAVYQMWL